MSDCNHAWGQHITSANLLSGEKHFVCVHCGASKPNAIQWCENWADKVQPPNEEQVTKIHKAMLDQIAGLLGIPAIIATVSVSGSNYASAVNSQSLTAESIKATCAKMQDSVNAMMYDPAMVFDCINSLPPHTSPEFIQAFFANATRLGRLSRGR